MSSILRPGQILRGRVSTYSLVKELYKATDSGVVFLARNSQQEKCIVKSVANHWRLQNEATILKKYQETTPSLRPLLDEIQEPAEPPSIVLKYLDADLLTESNKERLSRPQIKQVAKSILKALLPLHRDGLVHTDIKLDNIFVRYGGTYNRFTTIQLGDCGGVVSADSDFAREGHYIGTALSRSPEAALRLHWGTATDVWSFGNAVLSLLYGGNYHLFNPAIDGYGVDHKDYLFIALKRIYKFFGPFPQSYEDFGGPDFISVVNIFNRKGPPEKPFHLVTTKEIPLADKKFILKIMKMDPRDRPTVEQLLADEWFTEKSEDTRVPLKPENKT
ncbi:kinase-like domain-containing protein [Nemania sp. FL0916]|nr:kinase-like domain-containing protein [Nemania sp. FL0916]